ncbi:N-glycosylase/DNA lyase [Candidatus Bathyarchaeota archaeon]|nr:MAG: N-glycosylase/DNA lyase [Candidatus Bathyarchaeota archaeon]
MVSNNEEKLIKAIEELKRSRVRTLVEKRISEFKKLRKGTSREIFKELCFCILCANYSAERSIKIQKEIDDGFLAFPSSQLIEKLKEMGHRFPKTRASYIISARKHSDSIKSIVESYKDPKELREWLIKNIRGIGLKEASHFLRNIGYTELAILDFHILDLLARHGIIEKPKTLTKSRYLQIEDKLREISKRVGLNMAELDLYLWYIETGKILK